VLLTQAKDDQGIAELMDAVQRHREFLQGDQAAFQAARITRVRQEFLELLKEGVFRQLLRQLTADGRLQGLLQEILARRDDPYSASEALIQDIMGTA
jgi:LAO/AO transport system kinase